MATFIATRSNLTARQEAFCQAFAISNNGTQSAIKAGYSPHTASEMSSENLTLPKIQARIYSLKADAYDSIDDTKRVLSERRARLTEVMMHDIEAPVSAGHVIAAASELNKMDGAYAPVKIASIHVMSDADRALIAEVIANERALLGMSDALSLPQQATPP